MVGFGRGPRRFDGSPNTPPKLARIPLLVIATSICAGISIAWSEAAYGSPAASAAPATPTSAPVTSAKPDGNLIDWQAARYKPGTGLVINSRNGDFGNSLRLRAQFRYSVFAPDGGDNTHLMEIRRARIQYKGHSFGEHNKFKIEFAFSPRDLGYRSGSGISNIPVLSWFLDLGPYKAAKIKLGQYKVPFSKQRVISSGDLQLVDRSIGNGEFNVDRDTGIEVHSDDLLGDGKLQYNLGVYMNRGRNLRDAVAPKMMYLARAEYMPLGAFKNFSEGDVERLAKPRLAIGAAVGYLDDAVKNRGILGSAPKDGGTTDLKIATADVLFKMAGTSLFSEVYMREGVRTAGDALDDKGVAIPTEAARDAIGYFIQAGYLFGTHPVEIAARYGQVMAADGASLSDKNELGCGLSWYPGGHAWKLQADWFNEWGDTGFAKGDNRVRIQLQAAY